MLATANASSRSAWETCERSYARGGGISGADAPAPAAAENTAEPEAPADETPADPGTTEIQESTDIQEHGNG